MDEAVSDEEWSTVVGPIGRSEVSDFADAAADHNPLHLDDDFARAAGQPEAIVHGMLTLSRVVELALANLGETALAESLDVRFARPLPVEARFHLRVRRRPADPGEATRLELHAGDGAEATYLEGTLSVVGV